MPGRRLEVVHVYEKPPPAPRWRTLVESLRFMAERVVATLIALWIARKLLGL